MINKKKILINIHTHNRPDALAVNLTGLYFQTFRDFDIIIVDDASDEPIEDDPLIKIYKERFKHENDKLSFIRMEENNGIATNRALILDKIKEYDFVMDLNDDHLMERNCISKLIRSLSYDDVVAVGTATPMFFWPYETICRKYEGQVLNDIWTSDGQIMLKRGIDYLYMKGDMPINAPLEQPHVSQFMYKPESLKSLPKGYSILGFTEETDLALRLSKSSGKKLLFQPDAISWHMQYKKGGIREIKPAAHKKMIAADWQLFNKTWYKWVRERYGERT